nr:sigma factor [Ruminiclostridium cellobioparum]
MFAFALKRTMNSEDAEDLSQDIVYEILHSSPSLRNPEAFHGWLLYV